MIPADTEKSRNLMERRSSAFLFMVSPHRILLIIMKLIQKIVKFFEAIREPVSGGFHHERSSIVKTL